MPPTSPSSFAFIASTAALLDWVRAGFKKGFGACPCLPYSRMLAILALLPPSLLGSAKPTLISHPEPSRFCLAGDRPRERSSSPVERLSSLVPCPTTEERLPLTFAKTTSPPASSTLGRISSVFSTRRESRSSKFFGSFISTFAITSRSLRHARTGTRHTYRVPGCPPH